MKTIFRVIWAVTLLIFILASQLLELEITILTKAIIAFTIFIICALLNKTVFHYFNIFIFFFFFYNFTTPLLVEHPEFELFANIYSYQNVNLVSAQALIALQALTLLSILIPKGYGVSTKRVRSKIIQIRESINPRKILFLGMLAAIINTAIIQNAVVYVISNGFFDRIKTPEFINMNNWLLAGVYSLVGAIISIIYLNKNKKIALFALMLFSTYFIFDLAIGGRKLTFYFLIGVLVLKSLEGKLTSKHGALILIAGAMPILFRALIDKVNFSDGLGIQVALGFLGEFLFTSATGYIIDANYDDLCRSRNILNYFDWATYIIPRAIFESKPYSLAYNFAQYMDLGMGFATTPMAEAYCISREMAAGTLMVGLLLVFSILWALIKINPIIIIIIPGVLLDLNRGEISYAVIQTITITLFLCIAIMLSTKQSRR